MNSMMTAELSGTVSRVRAGDRCGQLSGVSG
jgi:hypothetical protein